MIVAAPVSSGRSQSLRLPSEIATKARRRPSGESLALLMLVTPSGGSTSKRTMSRTFVRKDADTPRPTMASRTVAHRQPYSRRREGGRAAAAGPRSSRLASSISRRASATSPRRARVPAPASGAEACESLSASRSEAPPNPAPRAAPRERIAHIFAIERPLASQHLVEDARQTPRCPSACPRPSACLLRQVHRAQDYPCLRHRGRRDRRRLRVTRRHHPRRLQRLRQPEVEDLHRAVRADHDVGGLEIAVDDVLLMRRFERIGDLLRDEQCLIDRQGPACDPLRQVLTLRRVP